MPFRFYLILFYFLISINVFSQKKTLQLAFSTASPPFKIKYQDQFISIDEVKREVQKIIFELQSNQFLASTIDTIYETNETFQAKVFIGPKLTWASLNKGNVDNELLSEVGFKERMYSKKAFQYLQVARLHQNIINWCENNGYPFATIGLDSVRLNKDTIAAKLFLNKRQLYKVDSVKVIGSAKVSAIYLYKYIGVKPGDIYNESLVKKVESRLQELPFVKLSKPIDVVFTDGKVRLILYLDKKNASNFDGVLGMLPDAKTGKINFTGDVRLRLFNTINRGELFDLNWRSLPVNTQDLKTRITYPYLFKTPFGVDVNLKIYKRDTTFIDVHTNFAVQYLFTGLTSFKVYVSDKNSSLLSTKGLQFITTLPPYADIRTSLYGLGFSTEKLDYRFNPRKGYVLTVALGAGNKRIKPNNAVNEVVYKNIKLRSEQYEGDLNAAVFLPLFKRSTFRLGVQGAFVYASTLFENEALRIGGFKTFRGIDEESIRATAFAIGTIEYRLLLEQNSYLYLFTDAAYYELNSPNGFRNDTPVGFGTGISFETKAGIFSINYALAKQFNNPILLRSGKIHFGLVNYF